MSKTLTYEEYRRICFEYGIYYFGPSTYYDYLGGPKECTEEKVRRYCKLELMERRTTPEELKRKLRHALNGECE